MLASAAMPSSRRLPDRLLAATVLREEALRAGFTRVGIARASEPPGFRAVRAVDRRGDATPGCATSRTRAPLRRVSGISPAGRALGALPRSARIPPRPTSARTAPGLARYARGPDYHGSLREQALEVVDRSRARLPGTWEARVCVDSTPIAERAFAAAAGLGWIGKNGCLIDAEQGSYLLLAEILTDLELPADAPVAEQCGSCTRCLDACPTGAFVEPGMLDAERCIAYWTIEHYGAVPDARKAAVGDHVFGCDVCQEVCPWNAPVTLLAAAAPPAPARAEILGMGKGAWRRRFGKTAVNRAARRGLQRNAALSAGARADSACLPALRSAAAVQEPGLADAARWALARLEGHPL